MERDGRLALVVGSFLIVAVLALGAMILSLTSERGIFVAQYRLQARFENVQGLLPGAPVWLAGKEVGIVETIEFEPVGADVPVEVSLGIDRAVQSHIRADSVATIGTIGLLGDSYVEITVGSAEARMLQDGQEIEASSPTNINMAVAQGARALENVTALAENLNEVVERFGDAGGGQRAADAIASVSDVMVQVRDGPGLLHSLLYDEYEGQGVESVERSLALLETILREIRDGEGFLHALIFDRPGDPDAISQAVAAAARLNGILEKVDRGEGTLGLLVNDPTVYEQLQQLLGGARRSLVLRSMVRLAVDEESEDTPPKQRD